jgi:hypothetical protein
LLQVYEDAHWLGLNAGVFLMRNSKWSFDYMDELMKIGEKGKARDSNAALLNKYVKGRAEISVGDERAHLSTQC